MPTNPITVPRRTFTAVTGREAENLAYRHHASNPKACRDDFNKFGVAKFMGFVNAVWMEITIRNDTV